MSRADSVDFASYDHQKRQVIVLGIPSLGLVSLRWVKSFYELRMPTNCGVVHLYREGKEVGDARNEIVACAFDWQARHPDTDVLGVFFIDDDVLPHPEALVKILSHQQPIMSGLYYMKYQVDTPLIILDEGQGAKRSWRPGEVVDCAIHGMGLTFVAMEVFRRLRDETDLGVDGFGFPLWFKTRKEERVVDAFGNASVYNETEDVYFLKRARALGYQPRVDTSAQAFAWHWHKKERRGYPLKLWTEYQTTRRMTWITDGEPIVWEDCA